MPEREVNSPVNTRNTTSKLRSNQPLSPGARSHPGRAGGPRFDNAQPEPEPQPQRRDRTVAHQEDPIPSSTPVTVGPEE